MCSKEPGRGRPCSKGGWKSADVFKAGTGHFCVCKRPFGSLGWREAVKISVLCVSGQKSLIFASPVSVSHLSVGEASHFLILPSNVPPVTLWVPPPPLLYPQSAGASISSSPSQMATGGVPHSCLPLRWPLGPPHGPLPLVGSPFLSLLPSLSSPILSTEGASQAEGVRDSTTVRRGYCQERSSLTPLKLRSRSGCCPNVGGLCTGLATPKCPVQEYLLPRWRRCHVVEIQSVQSGSSHLLAKPIFERFRHHKCVTEFACAKCANFASTSLLQDLPVAQTEPSRRRNVS